MPYYDPNLFSGYLPQSGAVPPYMPVPQQNCQCDNRFCWIPSKEAAKVYPQAPGKTIFFLDDREPYAYLRKTDNDGRTSEFKIFKLIEEVEEKPVVQTQPTNTDMVSKEEFSTFTKNVDISLNELKEMILDMRKKPYNDQRKQGRNNG